MVPVQRSPQLSPFPLHELEAGHTRTHIQSQHRQIHTHAHLTTRLDATGVDGALLLSYAFVATRGAWSVMARGRGVDVWYARGGGVCACCGECMKIGFVYDVCVAPIAQW